MENGKYKMGYGISVKHISLVAIALLLLVNHELKAQDETKHAEIKSLTKIRLTLFGAGFEREQKIGPLKSVYFGGSISSIYLFEPKYLGNGRAPDAANFAALLGVAPVFYTGFRKYFNLTEREKNNKKTINNSADYLGLHLSVTAPYHQNKYKTKFAVSLAPQWGMQRSLSKKVNFEFAFGPAVKTDFEATRIVPFSKLGFTFLL